MKKIIPVKTSDGSFTLYSPEYGEHYHGVKDGALAESIHKHVAPGFLYANAFDKDEITILDICFGLGLNTLAALWYAREQNYPGKLRIFAPELDVELIQSLKNLPYSLEFLPFLDAIWSVSNTFKYEDEKVYLEVVPGDAVDFVSTTNERFDIVFQDPFSPKKNPALWTEEYFGHIFRTLKEDGVVTTYSQAKPIRKILASLGFTLHQHPFPKTFPMRPGTLAAKRTLPKLDPLLFH